MPLFRQTPCGNHVVQKHVLLAQTAETPAINVPGIVVWMLFDLLCSHVDTAPTALDLTPDIVLSQRTAIRKIQTFLHVLQPESARHERRIPNKRAFEDLVPALPCALCRRRQQSSIGILRLPRI